MTEESAGVEIESFDNSSMDWCKCNYRRINSRWK